MALRADDVDLGRDRDLVARFQNGDPDAFDDLYRRYFDRLRRYCQRHTTDGHEAEEVAQEAFFKALRSMDALQGERRFYPWMTVIAKRIVIDRHRKMSRIELTEEPEMGSVEPEIDHLFDAVDAEHVRDALDRVGPRHREVLLLREAESLSYADIATTLDVPVTTVEALLHRARKALRREYAVVTGETPGLWGLPILGWLGARAGRLRTRIDDRWAEFLAVGAPVAVGVVTVAMVLGPAQPSSEPTVQAASPTTVVEAEPSAPSTMPPADTFRAGSIPAASPATPVTTTTQPSPTARRAPTIQNGPARVYLGPDGASEAADEAHTMPLAGDVGPVTGGVDPVTAMADVAEFISKGVLP